MTGIAPSILFQQGVGKNVLFLFYSPEERESTTVRSGRNCSPMSRVSELSKPSPAEGVALDSWILA
jgi:hypothetical protein